MILGNNHNDLKVKRLVNEEVGEPFSLVERIKQGGIGSQRMLIKGASEDLAKCLAPDQDLKYASIELRPKGIIVYLRNKVNEYIWVIPYYKLSVYKSEFFSLHADGFKLRFHLGSVFPSNAKFIAKMLDQRALQISSHPLN